MLNIDGSAMHHISDLSPLSLEPYQAARAMQKSLHHIALTSQYGSSGAREEPFTWLIVAQSILSVLTPPVMPLHGVGVGGRQPRLGPSMQGGQGSLLHHVSFLSQKLSLLQAVA